MNFKILLNRQYNEYLQKLAQMQNQYDMDTSNGTNSEEQKNWETKIKRELLRLETYSEVSFELKIK